MEINDCQFIENGTGNSVYTGDDKEKISLYAQRIQNGELRALISERSSSPNGYLGLKSFYLKLFDAAKAKASDISREAETLISTLSNGKAFFSFSISDEERQRMLYATSLAIRRIYALRDEILYYISSAYNRTDELLRLQNQYNLNIAALEMTKLAYSMIKEKYASDESASELSGALSQELSLSAQVSAFIDTVYSLASAYEDAIEKSIYRMLNDLADSADLSGNGARLEPSKAIEFAMNIKNTASNIIRIQKDLL